MQHYQDDPPADPDHMDHLYKITFWPITSKLINGFTPNFTCIWFNSGEIICVAGFEIHRGIKFL